MHTRWIGYCALWDHRGAPKGSHVFYRHPDGRTTTVPHHGGRDLARPLIREILREIEVSREEFERRLKE